MKLCTWGDWRIEAVKSEMWENGDFQNPFCKACGPICWRQVAATQTITLICKTAYDFVFNLTHMAVVRVKENKGGKKRKRI